MPENGKITAFLLDDHEMVRRGVHELLSGEDDIEVVGEGLTNRAIGERLHLAEKTIKNYVSSPLSKLGMERRSQATAHVARIQAEKQHH